MVCNRIVLRAGSCKDRATKLTCTTRGRRWARSRKSSWRSRCAEIASATSSRASYRSARVSQGDADCLFIGTQYGLKNVIAQELPAAPVAEAGLILMLEPLLNVEFRY